MLCALEVSSPAKSRASLKLISVHTPKAGGTSLSTALSKALGDAFQTDYQDDPADPTSERNIASGRYFSRMRRLPDGVSCIHGHFHPGQFHPGEGLLFTVLRHPVDNIISIYFFWKSLQSQGQPLHDYFLKNRLNIVEMAQLPLLRYLYSQTYFGGFDMGRFDLIGRHEDRASAFERLSRLTGIDLDVSLHENVTLPDQGRQVLLEDHSTIQKLHNILADDIRFYERFSK